MRDLKGFTLLEMLVSLLIFSIVMLAIYSLFDQGQWVYLHSEKQVNAQENARLVMEQMERDFRMIGAGVPTGKNITTNAVWTPFVFDATDATIAFTGDIDGGIRQLTKNPGTEGNAYIFIDAASSGYYRGLNTELPIVLSSKKSAWQNLVANSLYSNDNALVTTTDVLSPASFNANESSVQTLERVFYRMVNQAGSIDTDGICTDPYPFCSVQRLVMPTNSPTDTVAIGTWVTVATYVTKLHFDYYAVGSDTALVMPGDIGSIDKIAITLICRDRSRNAGQYQNTFLKSEVLIRNRRL
jgi:prepilin-type N-terminal cleavage/methylation domain-containing protein